MRHPIGKLGMVTTMVMALAAAGAALPAQDLPDEFVNLQVLDPDISKEELKATMKGFTNGLGVKCTFCHTLDEYDKDDNEHKQMARDMIRLVDMLRENLHTYFPEETKEDKITCWTCHRGEAEVPEWEPVADDDWVR